MEEVGVISVFSGWYPVFETSVGVIVWGEPVGPGLVGEGRIGDCEIEGFYPCVVLVLEIWGGQGVAVRDVGLVDIMEEHVHLCKGVRGVVFFLSVGCNAVGCFVYGAEEQGTGAAGRVVYGVVLASVGADADDLCHDSGDFGGCVELPLAFT